MRANDRPISIRHCSRPTVHLDDRLCFCPEPGTGRSVRQVLAATFINGWVGEHWMRRAAAAAADPLATDNALFALLWEIEYAANDAYSLWRDSQ